jgi:hypothetical protein
MEEDKRLEELNRITLKWWAHCRVGAMAEASLIILRKVNHPPGVAR